MDFEQARSIAWWRRPWWWGGHGTWWVAPWGLADESGWLMSVGARQWLRDRDPLYKPEPDTPLYFVTASGFPHYLRPEPDIIARIVAMQPVGEWPSGIPPPHLRLPP